MKEKYIALAVSNEIVGVHAVPWGDLSFGPIEEYYVFVTSACTTKTGAASQAFERMHNTLSHRSKTEVPGGNKGRGSTIITCAKRTGSLRRDRLGRLMSSVPYPTLAAALIPFTHAVVVTTVKIDRGLASNSSVFGCFSVLVFVFRCFA